jgi:putative flavoprotein involved in K+ transport
MREFSGLAHFPIPRRYPRYLSRDQVVEYLNEYARALNLRIATGATVGRIRVDGSRDRQWHVEIGGADDWRSRVVVVATGQYCRPVLPDWPGRPIYKGDLSHSCTYVNAAPFTGKRVLVVGAGNSGAETATDLADGGASFVAVSVRTPPVVVPRDPFGMPVQRTSILLSVLPAAIANRLGRLTARMTLGDLRRFGLPTKAVDVYTTKKIPIIDVGFVDALKQGRVTVRPAVERLSAEGAVFADGTSEPFDAIIAATGFSTGLESIIDAPGVLDAHGEPRGTSGEPTAQPGLYFAGFTHSLRGHLFEARLASLRLAKNVERYLVETEPGLSAYRRAER